MTLPHADPTIADSDAPLSGPEADLARYTTYNPWAIVALLLGLLSIFVLNFSLMFVAVVLTVACGIYALSEMEHDASAAWGRPLVVVGMTIALACAAFVITRQVSRGSYLKSEGVQIAQAWVELVQKKELEQAHQMTMEHSRRQLAGVNLKKFYGDSHENSMAIKQFFATAPLDKLTAAPPGTLELEQTIAVASSDTGEFIDQIFALHFTQAGQPRTLRLRIVTERTLSPGSSTSHWRINSVTDPNLKGL